MLADTGKALETTNMDVFVDKSYLNTTAPPVQHNYLQASVKKEKKDKKRKKRN